MALKRRRLGYHIGEEEACLPHEGRRRLVYHIGEEEPCLSHCQHWAPLQRRPKCFVHVAGVLEGKHFGNVTKAQRLFQRALDVDPSSEDAQLGFMQCKTLCGDALLQVSLGLFCSYNRSLLLLLGLFCSYTRSLLL